MDDQTLIGGVEAEPEPQQAARGEVGTVQAANEQIGVGSGDENVAKIQLAARWAEAFAPGEGDSLEDTLQRFHRVYTYIDSVAHGVAPDGP